MLTPESRESACLGEGASRSPAPGGRWLSQGLVGGLLGLDPHGRLTLRPLSPCLLPWPMKGLSPREVSPLCTHRRLGRSQPGKVRRGGLPPDRKIGGPGVTRSRSVARGHAERDAWTRHEHSEQETGAPIWPCLSCPAGLSPSPSSSMRTPSSLLPPTPWPCLNS